MNPVESFIENSGHNEYEILTFLHHYILGKENSIEPLLSYGIPFYKLNHRICYLNPIKCGGVDLVFINANLMVNKNLLNFEKRKQVGGIVFSKLNNIKVEILDLLFEDALFVDHNFIKKSKMKSKF